MSKSCTRILAEFVVGVEYKDIPSQAIEIAKRAIMDTIGVAVAGSQETISTIIRELIREESCNGEATIIGTKLRSSILNCSFCNGVISHALDYDDSYYDFKDFKNPTRIHPSSPILAACFALSEKVAASGSDFIKAFVLGIEVIGAMSRGLGASHYDRGWHTTSTVGTFGATAAASKLMNLKTEQLQVAFGIATSLASGSRQNFGTMVKPMHVGNAARNGVLSAILAAKGVTADENILDKPMGVALFCEKGDWNAEKTVTSIGNPWAIIQPGLRIKRYPSCGGTHRSLHALFQVFKENDINVRDIKNVYVFVPEYSKALIHPRPRIGLQGKFSMEYCIACGIMDGHIGIESFTDSAVLRPEIQAFLEKVRVVKKESLLEPSVKVEIECNDGSKYSSEILHVPGTPLYPLTWSELEEKYRQCVYPVLSSENVVESVRIIKDFENLRFVYDLINLIAKAL